MKIYTIFHSFLHLGCHPVGVGLVLLWPRFWGRHGGGFWLYLRAAQRDAGRGGHGGAEDDSGLCQVRQGAIRGQPMGPMDPMGMCQACQACQWAHFKAYGTRDGNVWYVMIMIAYCAWVEELEGWWWVVGLAILRVDLGWKTMKNQPVYCLGTSLVQ